MGLIGNGVRLSASSPMRVLGAPLAGVVDRANWNQAGPSRNIWCGDAAIPREQGIPSGHRHPSSWVMAPAAGGVASRGEVVGNATVAANLAGGLYAESSLAGAGDVAATIAGLANAASALAGAGDVSGAATALAHAGSTLSGSGDVSADIGALGGIAAALAGAGDLTGALSLIALASASISGAGTLEGAAGAIVAAASAISGACSVSAEITGALSLAASLAGSGDVVGGAAALANAVAAISAGTTLSGAPTAIGHLGADIAASSDVLTAPVIAEAVWNAVASALNAPGSMGELLNGAGGGSSPSQVADAVWSHATGVNVDTRVALIQKILRNRTETNPATGTITVYDDDGTTPLLTASLFEDVAGSAPYDGTGAPNRRNRLA